MPTMLTEVLTHEPLGFVLVASGSATEPSPARTRLDEARVKPPLGTPKTVKEIFAQRVSPDCVAQVVFEGPVSQKAIEKLIAYLQLAKDNYPEKTPFVLGDLKTYGSGE